MKRLVSVVLFALLALAACSKEKEAPVAEAPKEYVAKVNGVAISADDMKQEFNMLNFRAQQMFMEEGGLQSFLDELVKKEILFQEAGKRKYENDPEFKKLTDDYRKRIMIGFLLRDEVEKKAEVSDAEARKYYDDNRKDFVLETPEKGKPQAIEFEAVKELIKQRLSEEKKDKIFENYLAGLRKSYSVEINKEALGRAFGNAAAGEAEAGKP